MPFPAWLPHYETSWLRPSGVLDPKPGCPVVDEVLGPCLEGEHRGTPHRTKWDGFEAWWSEKPVPPIIRPV